MFRFLPRLLLVSGCALLAGLASNSIRAEGVQPPREFLHEATNNIIAGTVVAIDPAGKLSFDKLADIYGREPAPDRITLTTPDWVLGQVSVGERYLVAYTAFTISPVRPEEVIVNPAGPLMLVGAGLEPALFRDDERGRKLLAQKADEDEDAAGSREQIEELLAGLGSSDPQYQNYFAAELALSPELQGRLSSADLAQIGKFVRNPRVHPSARGWLLRSAARRAATGGVPWLDTAAIEIITEVPVTGHLAADDFSAALVNTAFAILEDRKTRIAQATLARWIVSDRPALAEQALLIIRRQSPEQERQLTELALARSLMSADTRAFLHDHLRRLELMQQALQSVAKGG